MKNLLIEGFVVEDDDGFLSEWYKVNGTLDENSQRLVCYFESPEGISLEYNIYEINEDQVSKGFFYNREKVNFVELDQKLPSTLLGRLERAELLFND